MQAKICLKVVLTIVNLMALSIYSEIQAKILSAKTPCLQRQGDTLYTIDGAGVTSLVDIPILSFNHQPRMPTF